MSSDSNRSRGKKSNTSGSGSSGISSDVNSTDDADMIYDEDLFDVDKDISLGNEQDSGDSLEDGLSVDELEFEVNEVYDSKGYIDDAIVKDVMDSADRRLAKKRLCENKKVIMCVFGAVALMAIIVGLSFSVGQDPEKREIEKRIEGKASAFNFNDHDEYIEPPIKTTEAATTETATTETATAETATIETATAETATKSEAETEDATTEAAEAQKTEAETTKITETTVTGTKDSKTFSIETAESVSLIETEIPLGDTTVFPLTIQNYLADPRVIAFKTNDQTPFFWQVPFAGGVFQSYMSTCVHLVLASNHIDSNDDELKKHYVRDSEFVNVDLSTTDGIEHAADKGLAESGLADVYVSNHVHFTTTALFGESHKGRLFTALRHPVDRALNEYQYVTSNSRDPNVKSMSLEEFVISRYMDKDWMTRFLINKRQVPLVREDIELAKEILRRRCVVGLHEDIEGSADLFENYFDWKFDTTTGKKAHSKCLERVVLTEQERAWSLYSDVGNIERGSQVYNTIAALNKFDMELYWYGNDLFEEQKEWVKSFRLSQNDDLS